MTGRDRLLSILNARPPGEPAWTTLADRRTRSVMPADFQDMTCLQFYEYIDCDVLQFGNFDLPKDLRVPSAARRVRPPVEDTSTTEPDGLVVRQTKTPWGTLTATTRGGHPIKHPVETLDELRILRNIWEESRYEETDGMEEACARLDRAIGDRGIYCPTLGPSPVQQLIEMDMGVVNFYALCQEERAELEGLLDLMHARRMQEYEIVARRAPVPGLIAVENTSTTLISPALYRRYSLPQIRDFVNVAHKHGKKAILHMCGLLKGLLPCLAETGLDAINALTPPPVGDLPYEQALDALGEDLVIMGGILDPTMFHGQHTTRERIWQALDEVYTPRVRAASLLLWVQADGVPVPLDRFLAVRDWMERNRCA